MSLVIPTSKGLVLHVRAGLAVTAAAKVLKEIYRFMGARFCGLGSVLQCAKSKECSVTLRTVKPLEPCYLGRIGN